MRAVVVVMVLLTAAPSVAFLCTRTDQGASLAWHERTVELRAHDSDTQDVIYADVLDAVTYGGEQWSAEGCSDFAFEPGPATREKRVGFDWRAGSESPENQNIIIFREGGEREPLDQWLHASTALAITTVTFLRSTGRIVDADVEVNDVGFTFTNCEAPDCEAVHDLKNTLTHELGHVLGLDHPPPFDPDAESATMFASAPAGDMQKRTLADDDVEGLCTLYPAGGPAGDCGDTTLPEPPRVRVREVGCAAAEGAAGPVALLLLGLVAGRRGRRADLSGR